MKISSLRNFIVTALLIASAFSTNTSSAQQESRQPVEPNAELAKSWWPPQKNVWTPLGWKDHLFRFNVVYNGTIVADPHPWKAKKHSEKWKDQGVQLTITTSADGKPLAEGYHLGGSTSYRHRLEPKQGRYQLCSTLDKGLGNQGFTDNAAPVLWTKWPIAGEDNSGLVLKESVFTHIPGAADVVTGVEPLYAWIRLSVDYVDPLKAPKQYCFIVYVGGCCINRIMMEEGNLIVDLEKSAYPRRLSAESFSDGTADGLRIMEPDRRVRLIAMPSDTAVFDFNERGPDSRDYYLAITLPVREGAFADLLLPMIPADVNDINKEMALGFEGALAGSDAYWSIVPDTAARVHTPEEQINQAIAHSLKFAQLITEKNPETGQYSFVTGSWQYDALWPTPTSMTSHMLLDIFGYYSVVEKHIDIFKDNQGTIKPPGPAYKMHPGYFSSPKTLTSIDWLSDHGAILYQVCKHALLTGDRKFIDKWLDNIIKGCEFITDARAIEDHNGVPAVLPPAVATDRSIPNQSVWSVGWNHKALVTAARLLERIGHEKAEEFAIEAGDYKKSFVKVFREHAENTPRWTDSKGRKRPLVPLSLSKRDDFFHAFYLDTGPMFLVWSQLMQADDELMRSAVDFFRQGPNTKIFDPRDNCWQRPVLIREISSCEPCYSWNAFHSWQLGDRYRYLECMYSLLTGALSPQTYISCETRHGIFGNVFASVLLTDLVRLSVIDDELEADRLHLLRLVPKAWLRSDIETEFENMPTEFGPVTIKFALSKNHKDLKVTYNHKFRRQPEKVMLHIPPVETLRKVVINGKSVKAGPGDVINISKLKKL